MMFFIKWEPSQKPTKIMCQTTVLSNKSPEPTRIGAVSCPQGFRWFHIAGSGWLSFFRSAAASLSPPCHCRRTLHIVVARLPTDAMSSFARHTTLGRRILRSILPIRRPQPNHAPEPMSFPPLFSFPIGRPDTSGHTSCVVGSSRSWLSLVVRRLHISDVEADFDLPAFRAASFRDSQRCAFDLDVFEFRLRA